MSSSLIRVPLSGPRVFSEKDEPQESMRPQTRAVIFHDIGNSLGVSSSSERDLATSATPSPFSSDSERWGVMTALSTTSVGPAVAFSEDMAMVAMLCGCGQSTEEEGEVKKEVG